MEGTVVDLWRYPVSSFAGERLAIARLTQSGLEGDRLGAFFEVESGQIVFPSVVRKWNLAPQIAARLREAVEISLDGGQWRHHDDPRLGVDLKRFTGTEVAFRPYGATTRQRYDWQPVHILSRQALEALAEFLPESRIDARRFRPNIVIDLHDAPGRVPEYALIGQDFRIGALRFRGLRPAGRCSFTTLAQEGLPEDHAILRGLIDKFGKNFGIYARVLTPGTISLGDALELTQRPLVIVGGGQAGAMLAKSLRDLGATQPIEIFAAETHPPYERPPLSKSPEPPPVILSPGELDGVTLHLNRAAVALHRATGEVESSDGARHPYDRLVLATGGRPRRLPGIRGTSGRIITLRGIEDAQRLHAEFHTGARIAILGAGWLGLELASLARRRGADVTVFARAGRILNRTLPANVAAVIESRHRAEGVRFQLGAMPKIEKRADGVVLAHAGGTEVFDILVEAIGIRPEDELARLAGLACSDGIDTDADGTTSDPKIFALGDVARRNGQRIESWHNANDQAQALAQHLMGMPRMKAPMPRFWSHQHDLNIQIAGLPDPEARAQRIEDDKFWDFGSFAVGINCPREIHRFAGSSEDDPSTEPLVPRQAPTSSHRLGPVRDFPPSKLHRVELPFGPVLIVQQDGFHAADDRCPHAATALSQGFVERGRVVCPVHFAEFDLQTGQAFNAPPGCGHLHCYAVEQRGDDLFLLA